MLLKYDDESLDSETLHWMWFGSLDIHEVSFDMFTTDFDFPGFLFPFLEESDFLWARGEEDEVVIFDVLGPEDDGVFLSVVGDQGLVLRIVIFDSGVDNDDLVGLFLAVHFLLILEKSAQPSFVVGMEGWMTRS